MMHRARRRLAMVVVLGGLALGCATATAPPPPAAEAPSAPTQPFLALQWQRTAAEHRAVYTQTFRLAGERLEELARDREPGTWAVISDADETILDNSLYAVERAAIGAGFTSESWTQWVARREAPALPGARDFLQRVHELGGVIAIVTNRKAHECADTEANFVRERLPYDVVLCRPPESDGDKEPRFRAVEEGGTPAELPPLEVILYLGDNIDDFPGADQEIRRAGATALAPFGDRWFVFPNPVYGSWEENAAP